MKAWILIIPLVLWATLPGARSLPREKWSDTAEVKWSALNRSSINTEQTVIQTAGIFKGCYSDTEGHILGKTGWTSESDKNFNADCKESCIKEGYAVASTRGRYCYCTDSLPLPLLYHPNNKYAAGNEGPCNLTCPGAFTKEKCVRDECCGGENAYTVYTLGQWPDTDQLHTKADEEGYTMILNLQDTKLQDIEYSEGETQNNEPLASIQSIGTFDGCYSDTNASVLGTTGIVLELPNNYNALCQQNCKEKGYAIASTKGKNCYCTNTFPFPQLHPADDERSAGNKGPCNVACPSSITAYLSVDCIGDECCGGPNAYSVYIVGQIDTLKQLQRRIINRVMQDSQVLQLPRGPDFYVADVIHLSSPDAPNDRYYYDKCAAAYEVSQTRTIGPRPITYGVNTLTDYRSVYVFNIRGNMDSECTFQRMKLTFLVSFSVVTTSDARIQVFLITQENLLQLDKRYPLKDLNRVRAYNGYYYTVDIQFPTSTRASLFAIDFVSVYGSYQEKCMGAYAMSATVDVWGTGCSLKLPRYGVSVIARGQTATNQGIGRYVTYKLTTIHQEEDLEIDSSSIDEELDMRLVSMNKLVEREESSTGDIFLNYDVVCDNIYSGSSWCTRTFAESARFEQTFTTQHGVDITVKVGVESRCSVCQGQNLL